jgi:hypothetical protein
MHDLAADAFGWCGQAFDHGYSSHAALFGRKGVERGEETTQRTRSTVEVTPRSACGICKLPPYEGVYAQSPISGDFHQS